MRFVVYGTGAVGGVLGGRLTESGAEVCFIARGAQYEAIKKDGLRIDAPSGSSVVHTPVFGHPGEVGLTEDDVVVLSVKSQDTGAALDDLQATAPPGIALVCAQNGVENERMALRRFERVYGMCVVLAASYLSPGVVVAHSASLLGVADLGRYPGGLDATARAIGEALTASGWRIDLREEVMRFKYLKLLRNLGNAVHAICGSQQAGASITARARAEGEAALTAAGIEWAADVEWGEERAAIVRFEPVGGSPAPAGSSWQSLARGAGSIETDYLNGEIVLLGRLFGVPTPTNALLCTLANRLARDRSAPGAIPEEELLALLAG